MAARRPATSGWPSDSAASSCSIASRFAKIAAARAPASRNASAASADRPPSRSCAAISARRAEVVATTLRQVQPQGVRDASMQQAASGHAGRLIGQVAQAAMGEVEPGAGLPDEAAPQQIIERVHGLALGSTAGVTDRAQVERPSDDGRRSEDLAGRLSGGGQPRAQDGPDPDRHRRERRFAGGEGLDDIERQAFGRLDQAVDDVGVRGRCSGQFGDRGTIEPARARRRRPEAP